jgi:cyanophycinase
MRLPTLFVLTGLVGACTEEPQPVEETDAPPADTDLPAGEARVRWMLHGGGPEDDAVFVRFVEAAGSGTIVTLGAVGEPTDPDLDWWDGYFLGLGAAEAFTLDVATEQAAADLALAARLDEADGIFLRGGDQSLYVERWWDGPVGDALNAAWDRGAVFGGSSAGCAVLGQVVYDARRGSLDPWDALLDGAPDELSFTAGLRFGVPGVLTDTHFTERGRLPRLALMFADRLEAGEPLRHAIGVDPRTALFLREDGRGEVVGLGSITVLAADETASWTLTDGAPPQIEGLTLWQLPEGSVLDLEEPELVVTRPSWASAVERPAWSVEEALTLDGAVGAASRAGSVEVSGDDEAYGWYDGALTLVDGLGRVDGAVVTSRLLEDSDLAESRVGGLLWALADGRVGIGLGLDLDTVVEISPDGLLRSTGQGAAIVLQPASGTYAGVPSEGWQSAYLEAVRLDVVGDTIELSR